MALRTSLARLAAVALAGCVPADDDTSGAASATSGATSDADSTTDASTTATSDTTSASTSSTSAGESEGTTGEPPPIVCPEAVAAPALVVDLEPVGGANPQRLFAAGADGCALYFNALIAGEITLWRTDASELGTHQVTPEPRYFGQPIALGEQVIFFSDDRPWRTDGSAAGTYALMEGWALPGFLSEAAVFAGELYFAARDVVSRGVFVESEHGVEPWRTDGTIAGTALLVDTAPGPEPEVGGPFGFTPRGDQLHFWAGPWPGTLWRTDGTTEGTAPVIDVGLTRAPIDGAPPRHGAAALGERLVFLGSAAGEFGIWASDGTTPGTEPSPASISRAQAGRRCSTRATASAGPRSASASTSSPRRPGSRCRRSLPTPGRSARGSPTTGRRSTRCGPPTARSPAPSASSSSPPRPTATTGGARGPRRGRRPPLLLRPRRIRDDPAPGAPHLGRDRGRHRQDRRL